MGVLLRRWRDGDAVERTMRTRPTRICRTAGYPTRGTRKPGRHAEPETWNVEKGQRSGLDQSVGRVTNTTGSILNTTTTSLVNESAMTTAKDVKATNAQRKHPLRFDWGVPVRITSIVQSRFVDNLSTSTSTRTATADVNGRLIF